MVPGNNPYPTRDGLLKIPRGALEKQHFVWKARTKLAFPEKWWRRVKLKNTLRGRGKDIQQHIPTINIC